MIENNLVEHIIGTKTCDTPVSFWHDNTVCARYYVLAENVHSQNSVLLISLNIKFSSDHRVCRFYSRIRFPISRNGRIRLQVKYIYGFAVHCFHH